MSGLEGVGFCNFMALLRAGVCTRILVQGDVLKA